MARGAVCTGKVKYLRVLFMSGRRMEHKIEKLVQVVDSVLFHCGGKTAIFFLILYLRYILSYQKEDDWVVIDDNMSHIGPAFIKILFTRYSYFVLTPQ